MGNCLKKSRVLFFHPALAPYRIDFFNGLKDVVDLRVVFLRENLLCQKFDQNRLLSELEVDYGFLTQGFDVKGRPFRLGIIDEIRKFNPGIVVASEFSPITVWLSFIKVFFRKTWKLIIHTDDNVRMFSGASWFKRSLRSYVCNNTDGVIVCNNDLGNLYIKTYGYPESRVAVCPIIRDEVKHTLKLSRLISLAESKKEKEFINRKKVILFVGRLVDIKGVDRLIYAVARIVKHVKNVYLVVVGDGSERQKLEKLVETFGVGNFVHFTGRLEGDDLHCWYLMSDVFVLASHFEAYGTVVNEALLAGLPVVCSSYAGAKNLIVENQNGCTFDPYDIDSLSEILISKLRGPSDKNSDRIVLKDNLTPVKFNKVIDEFMKVVRSLQT